MSELVVFVLLGLATGSVYGLAGVGLVVTYKTSGIFNFAHGAVAAAAAYLFFELHQQRGLPWPLAAAITLLIGAPLVGLLLERIARELANVPTAYRVVATIGLLLGIQGLVTAVYGSEQRFFPAFLPTGTVQVVGAGLGVDQLILVGVAALGTLGLSVFFRVSAVGTAMRAVVDDPALLDLCGTNPATIRRAAWTIGSVFAALSGLLLAPTVGLDSLLLTFLVVQAFGAAAVGRFSSLPLTYLGGLLIGVTAALATNYLGQYETLSALPSTLPFLVLLVVLLLTPRNKLSEPSPPPAVRPSAPSPVRGARLAAVSAVAAAAVLAVPVIAETRLPVFTNAAIFVVIFLSLALLVNLSGQVSLCHAAFAAVGAAAFAQLTAAGVPWLLALLAAALATVPLGLLVAVPAVRLSGLFLALATFGLALVLERIVYPSELMFGATGTLNAPRPNFAGLGSDVGFYYLCCAVAAAVAMCVVAVRRSRLGRLLASLAESPVALETMGASVNVTRVLVFCVSSFLAGVAGALFGALSGSVSGVTFSPLTSLLWLAVLAIGGRRVYGGAVAAAIGLAVIPSYLGDAFADYLLLVFGVLAVAAALSQRAGSFSLSAAAARSSWRLEASPVRRVPATSRGPA